MNEKSKPTPLTKTKQSVRKKLSREEAPLCVYAGPPLEYNGGPEGDLPYPGNHSAEAYPLEAALPPDSQRLAAYDYRYCMHCKEPLKGPGVCHRCGKKTGLPDDPDITMMLCPHCHGTIEPDGKYCPFCGVSLLHEAAEGSGLYHLLRTRTDLPDDSDSNYLPDSCVFGDSDFSGMQ